MTWTTLAALIALSVYLARRLKVSVEAEPEDERRRRALAAISTPISEKWRLQNGYAKDGRDHR